MTQTVGDMLPKEMARVRDEVMPAYQSIGINGRAALMLMRRDLDNAAQAMAEGDVIGMIRSLKALQGYES
jgi:hypothetical protein